MSTINPAAALAPSSSTEPILIRSFRSFRNTFKEARPYGRPSVTLRPHAVAWEHYTKQFARATKFYVPATALFFGWPFAAMYAINAWNGVYDAPAKKGRR